MEVLDLNIFLSYKTNNELQDLDNNTLDILSVLFGNTEKYKNLKKNKKNVNILKNQKLQNKKDNIINRVNLILNKLSDSNMDNLVVEFIENINQVDSENYDNIMKAFYIKIMSEINFCKLYLKFLKTINFLYQKVMNYNLSYFISMIQTKFCFDYMQKPINIEKFNFIVEMEGETKRINNNIIIKNLVDIELLSKDLIKYCDNIILNQITCLPDIYHWFNSKNRELTHNELNKIKNILLTKNITPRDKILLENLSHKKEIIENDKKEEVVIIEKTNTIKLEIDNIIDEYILLKSVDDVKFFIENRCLDAITKNKFCEQLIDKYFLVSLEETNDIIELIKQLIKSHILFKSNISRGLTFINNNWKEKSVDYTKPIRRMKTLLSTLKSIGITKGLEQIIDFYLSADN
jgi:hypothetical protein